MSSYKRNGLLRLLGIVFVFVAIGSWVYKIVSKSVYIQKVGINVLVVSKNKTMLIGLRPESNLILKTMLTNDLVSQMGERSTGSGFTVGAVSGQIGAEYQRLGEDFRKGLSLSLGVPLTGIFYIGEGYDETNFFGKLILPTTKSNLSWLDRIRIYLDMRRIFAGSMVIDQDIPKGATQKSEEADGKVVYNFNEAIFNWSKNQWSYAEVFGESVEIAVVNATNIDGRARSIAHLLETAGMHVIEVVSSKSLLTEFSCLVYDHKPEATFTKQLLENYFGCVVKTDSTDNYGGQEVSADMIVVLGNR